MKNFDTELDRQGVTRMVTSNVVIEESVRVIPRPSESRAYLGKSDWEWDDLRDYVVAQIEQRFGVFPRDSRKEASIFKSFLGRWGQQAQQIARFAFEVEDGYWKGSPVSVNRFCKASDPYFSEVIARRLAEDSVR